MRKGFVLKTSLFLLLLSLLLLACSLSEHEVSFSQEMQEPATIVDLVFTPKRHTSTISTSLDSHFNVQVVPVSIRIPERYAVVFQCQHGKFVIDREPIAEEMWRAFRVNQKVTVYYREEYLDRYRVTRKWYGGLVERKLIERQLRDYYFIQAIPVDLEAH